MTKTIDGVTYTKVDADTYRDPNGGEWVAFEAGDMRRTIRWAGRKLAILAGQDLTYDAAAERDEVRAIQAATEQDLRIVEQLFG